MLCGEVTVPQAATLGCSGVDLFTLFDDGCSPAELGVGHILGSHHASELPGDNVSEVVVEHRGQIHPSPADHLKRVESVCHI